VQNTKKTNIGKGTMTSSKRDFNFGSASNLNNTISGTSTTPGPGRYGADKHNTIGQKATKSGVKFDKSERKLIEENWNKVGPGQYMTEVNTSSFSGKKNFQPKFSKSKRDELFNNTLSPGPGRYNNNNSTFHSNNFSNSNCNFGIKKSNTILLSPGPGQYEGGNISGVKSNQPKWKFSLTKKEDGIKPNNLVSPGPGRYSGNTNFLSNVKNQSGVKFDKDKKMKDNLNPNPGPGQYYIPCSFRNINDYSTVNSKFEKSYNVV